MGRKRVGLEARIKEGLRIGSCVSIWVSLDLVQFGLEIESDLDALGLDCFSSLRTINMYLMIFVKKDCHHVLQTTTLGAPPPLILGFLPSKRHAALIASCDQGSVVLTFTLVLFILKRFLWRVVLVILIFVV